MSLSKPYRLFHDSQFYVCWKPEELLQPIVSN